MRASPWILFIAHRADDLYSLCSIESERAWIARMFRGVSDTAAYDNLITGYTAEGLILEARRRRVRNALVHENPTSHPIVDSVREYAEFLSGTALQLGLKSYVNNLLPASVLAQRTDEFAAMHSGGNAAEYWRSWLAANPDVTKREA